MINFVPPLAIFEPKKKFGIFDDPILDSVKFTVHKYNNRPKPVLKSRIKIISCFSEFGCETIGCMYCIPRLMKVYPGQYSIAMGWYGREYLYRHLVDEFWEIDEEFMFLKEYSRAFHHVSINLKKIERAAAQFGDVVPSAVLGKYTVSNVCRTCGKFWYEWRIKQEKCPACSSTYLTRSVLTDIANYKSQVRNIPRPSKDVIDWAKNLIKPNSVGIFARNRKTYGRNLPSEFYIKLISLLESMGYNIVWLGEKSSTLPCPVNHIVDFSRLDDSRDLEKTLAIISSLEFTIQFWTASTRLSSIMRVPFIIFESPEQIYSSKSGLMSAQEGKRLELVNCGNKKVVLSHYFSVLENQDKAIDIVKDAVNEMKAGNWGDIIGLVEDVEFTKKIQKEFYEMLT